MTIFLNVILLSVSMLWGGGHLLNGTAAVVGKNLISVQDVYFYRAIHRLKDGGDPFDFEKGEVFKKTLKKMIFEELIGFELASLDFKRLKSGDGLSGLTLPKAKLLTQIGQYFHKSELEARERMKKSLIVEEFLQKKIETLTPIITESESRQYYDQNRSRFQSSNYDELRPSIVKLLKKNRVEKGVEEWIKTLKEKFGVQNFIEK